MEENDVIEISDRTYQLDTQTIASAIGDIVKSGGDHIKLLENNGGGSRGQGAWDGDQKKIFENLKKKFRKEIAEQVETTYKLPRKSSCFPLARICGACPCNKPCGRKRGEGRRQGRP